MRAWTDMLHMLQYFRTILQYCRAMNSINEVAIMTLVPRFISSLRQFDVSCCNNTASLSRHHATVATQPVCPSHTAATSGRRPITTLTWGLVAPRGDFTWKHAKGIQMHVHNQI